MSSRRSCSRIKRPGARWRRLDHHGGGGDRARRSALRGDDGGLFVPETIDGYREMKHITEPYGTKVFVQLFHGGRRAVRLRPPPRDRVVRGGAVAALPQRAAGDDDRRGRACDRVVRAIRGDRRRAAGSTGSRSAPPTTTCLLSSSRPRRTTAPIASGCLSVSSWKRSRPSVRRLPDLPSGCDSPPRRRSSASSANDRRRSRLLPRHHWGLGDLCRRGADRASATVAAQRRDRSHQAVPRAWPSRDRDRRIDNPAEADAFIAAGKADAVGMNRAFITDPDMPAKAPRGELDSVFGCMGATSASSTTTPMRRSPAVEPAGAGATCREPSLRRSRSGWS